MWKGITLDSIAVRKEIDGTAISPYLAKGASISGNIVDGNWLHMTAPRIGWVNAGVGMTKVKWEVVTVIPPPPPPTKRLTNIIQVFEDGSINVTPQ